MGKKIYLWQLTSTQLDELEESNTMHVDGKIVKVEWIASDCIVVVG